MADAIVRACGNIPCLGGPEGGSRCLVLNVGSGVGIDVAHLAAMTLRALGRTIPIRERVESGKQRPGAAEIYRLIADPQRAREGLDWRARTPLHAGLAATVRSAVGPE